jgi:circadian clock protein KaiC
LINDDGISVMPVTSLALNHEASTEVVPSGIATLDEMLGGSGFYRGSSILVSGAAGTGKTSISCSFVRGGCERGERCLYFAFEESPAQIMRNMQSIGIDLKKWIDRGLLRFVAERSTSRGLEAHLVRLHDAIRTFDPSIVVIDPISNLIQVGSPAEVRIMLSRLLDMLKSRGITTLTTSLVLNGEGIEDSGAGISSLMDVWIDLRNIEINAERNRAIYILKARGQQHSNQVREFLISSHGIELVDVYVGPQGVVTGSARHAMQASEMAARHQRSEQAKRRLQDFERRSKALEAQIAAMRADFAWQWQEAEMAAEQEGLLEERQVESRAEMARHRTSERATAPEGKRAVSGRASKKSPARAGGGRRGRKV